MKDMNIAVLGIGATGAVLASAIIKQNPDTVLFDPMPGLKETILKNGIRISGALSYEIPVNNFASSVSELKAFDPDVIFISTKTFHLKSALESLKGIVKSDVKIISTHNGLGPEDLVAEYFGKESAFRMSLNYGVSLKGPGEVEANFFNKPNHLGALSEENMDSGKWLATLLTEAGLDTEYVDDIKLYVWKKMVMKCTMAPICAVTDRTIKEALDFPPTREIADACFDEVLAVAKAMGYDLGKDYRKQIFAYLDNVGMHKDSMCYDIANKTQTEIDFLGGKVVEYGRKKGVPTPFYIAMTNLVKSMEDSYLK